MISLFCIIHSQAFIVLGPGHTPNNLISWTDIAFRLLYSALFPQRTALWLDGHTIPALIPFVGP